MKDQVQKLCEAFTEATGYLCSAGEDNDGQIIIYTNLRELPTGELQDMDTDEVMPRV